MKTSYKLLILVSIILLMSSCYVTRPDALTSMPDYNSRVTASNAHYDNVLSPIGAGTIIAGTATGMYLGYKSSMFTHYNGADQKKLGIGGMVVGGFLGFYATKYINEIFGWKKITYPNSPQEWLDKTNNEFILTRQTDNRNFILTHKSAENKFIVKNIQDARDFKTAFSSSSYTNNVAEQTIYNSGIFRNDYPELMQLFPSNQSMLDMKKRFVILSTNVPDIFSAIDKYPETKLNIEKKAASLSINYSDAFQFNKRYPKSKYNNQVIINSLNQSSDNEVYNMYSLFKKDYFLNSYDFQLFSTTDVGKKKYSNALYRIKNPNSIYALETFYFEYDWLKYSEKPDEIINNYWNIANSSYSDGNLILSTVNSLATDNSYSNWNISKSKINSFVSNKLEYEINTKFSFRLNNIVPPKSKQWAEWINNNNMTAGLVTLSNLSYLLSGTIVNNSKFDLPLKLTFNAEVYRTYKIEGTIGTGLEILEVIGQALDDQHRRVQLNEKTDFIGSYSENYYMPSLKRNDSHTFAVIFDVGSKAGINAFDWVKLTVEIEIKNASLSKKEYYNDYVSQGTQQKQNTWLHFAQYGMPDVKLIDRWRNEEYNDAEWERKNEIEQERKRQARIEAERRRQETKNIAKVTKLSTFTWSWEGNWSGGGSFLWADFPYEHDIIVYKDGKKWAEGNIEKAKESNRVDIEFEIIDNSELNGKSAKVYLYFDEDDKELYETGWFFGDKIADDVNSFSSAVDKGINFCKDRLLDRIIESGY